MPNKKGFIIVGQYQDWGEVNYFHLITITIVIGFVLIGYRFIKKHVFNKRDMLCNEIMKGRLRLDDKNNSKNHQKLINYFNQQKQYQKDLLPELNLIKGDPGYDISYNNNNKPIHFNTSIAKSYFVLEEGVRSIRPNLKHRNYRTIRDFVNAIKYEFPFLKNQCNKYINYYELARFGNYKFTNIEYKQFFILLKEMVTKLQESNLQAY